MNSIEVLRPKFGERDTSVVDTWPQVTQALKEEGSEMPIGENANRITVDSITFRPGERTEEHIHPYGQILHVLEGEGTVAQRGEDPCPISRGDVVLIPPDVCHWHGTGPDAERCLTHLAFVLRGDEEGTDHCDGE